MIRIRFEEPSDKAWRDWKDECEAAREKAIREVKRGIKPYISSLYKDARLTRIYKAAGRPFHGKCAYCESGVRVNQPGDIEHWRPKSALEDKCGRPVLLRVRDSKTGNVAAVEHMGYYWLAYDWSNLLLSCATCNRITRLNKHRIGKGAQFPVIDFRASSPGQEVCEKPLLLNPMFDDPLEHMKINCKSGFVIPKTERGRITIEIFGLNVREHLVAERKRCIQYTQHLISLLGLLRADGKVDQADRVVALLCAIAEGEVPHSAAGRAVLASSGCAIIK